MKVLLATDGSTHAELAEAIGLKIPNYKSAEWTVATVVSPMGGMLIGVEPFGAPIITEDLQRLFEASLSRGNAILSETVHRLNSNGIRPKSQLLEAQPETQSRQVFHPNRPDRSRSVPDRLKHHPDSDLRSLLVSDSEPKA